MNWLIEITKNAKKELARIPVKQSYRISVSIDQLSIDPYSGDIQKIKGEKDVWRKRIGSYRIFYEFFPKGKVILIFKVKRRTSHTY